MYKAILVDDESIIRNAISTTIDWNKFNFELVDTCQNATQAIEILKHTHIDLIITDICMPHMDGLELSSYVYNNYPDTSIVIISGYDDFNYAKAAIRYNVTEYLLKPVTADEFSQILLKLKNTLDEKTKKEDYINKIKQIYDENLSNIKNRFFANLIVPNSMSADYISQKLEEFQPNLDGPYYCCAIFEALPQKSEDGTSMPLDALSYFSLFSTAKDIITSMKAGEVIQDSGNVTIAYFSADTMTKVRDISANLCSEIHSLATKLLSIRLNISIGKPVFSLHKLSVSYQSAQALKENFFLSGNNRIINYSEYKNDNKFAPINRTEWTNNILMCIKKNQMDELDFLIEKFIELLKQHHMSRPKAILDIQSVILSIMNFLEQSLFNTDEILNDEQHLLDALASDEPLNDIDECMKTFCHKAAATIHTKHEDYNQNQANLALTFIKENYNNPDLSLADICSHLGMSTSRFSSVFKTNTGETFVEALTRMRMEAAKELMIQTNLKSYEIAEKVGFTDSHYFGIAFKKYSGMTPTEFIKSNSQQGD